MLPSPPLCACLLHPHDPFRWPRLRLSGDSPCLPGVFFHPGPTESHTALSAFVSSIPNITCGGVTFLDSAMVSRDPWTAEAGSGVNSLPLSLHRFPLPHSPLLGPQLHPAVPLYPFPNPAPFSSSLPQRLSLLLVISSAVFIGFRFLCSEPQCQRFPSRIPVWFAPNFAMSFCSGFWFPY